MWFVELVKYCTQDFFTLLKSIVLLGSILIPITYIRLFTINVENKNDSDNEVTNVLDREEYHSSENKESEEDKNV